MKLNKGFTLIELLVVIAIIGILSSVVLASLNTARDKGSNAAAKSNITQMRASAELQSNDGANYTSVCASGVSKTQYDAAVTVTGALASDCQSDTSTWAAYVTLKNSEGTFCVDYTGKVGSSTISAATPWVCL